jgi:hypothetical protein
VLAYARKVLQTFFQPLTMIANFYQTGVRYVVNNPIKVILFGLAIEAWVVVESADRKCGAVFPNFDFPPNDLTSDYYHQFDIYANVDKLSRAEYILIGLHTHSIFQFETQNKLINYLATTDDIIYFSGAYGQFNCQTLCLNQNEKPTVTDNLHDCLPLLPINNNFTCLGWENAELARRLAFNKFLFDTINRHEKIFYRLDKVRLEYVALRTSVTQANVGIDTLLTTAIIPEQDSSWFLNMSKLLNIIQEIYKEFFENDFEKMWKEIAGVKRLIPHSKNPLVMAERAHSIKQLMNDIIPRVDKAILELFEELYEFTQYKEKNYDNKLTEDMRIAQGLVVNIELSKMHSNKKFFVSPANQYINNSAKPNFFCNTSRIRSDVYNSLKDKPFAILAFKRRFG